MEKERYDNLDGLRVISCLAIIAMHIRANSNYQISGWVYNTMIPSWTQFVPLFLLISGFGMFCGYYEKFRSGKIDINYFYKKRYIKILPFFIFLMLIDVVMDRSISHIIEALTQATLVFGLLPNNQPEVIGVCWTLGVIFLFYLLFPFFVWICWDKKRAAISFGISVVLTFFCTEYYFTDKFVVEDFAARHNFLYCVPFFIGGGYSYLEREKIKSFVSKYKGIWLSSCIVLTVIWYLIPNEINGFEILILKNSILFLSWLWYAISVKSMVLSNKVTNFLSKISLELYLAQMVIYRAIEKVGLLYKLGTGWISFIFVWLVVVFGLIIFIQVWKKCYGFAQKKLQRV